MEGCNYGLFLDSVFKDGICKLFLDSSASCLKLNGKGKVKFREAGEEVLKSYNIVAPATFLHHKLGKLIVCIVCEGALLAHHSLDGAIVEEDESSVLCSLDIGLDAVCSHVHACVE